MLGSGAREHALLLALSRDPAVTGLVCAPGNAGTAALRRDPAGRRRPTAPRSWRSPQEVGADLVVVGPEVPLVAGVADAAAGRRASPCFGPSAAAAQIEGSKSFAKQVMAAAGRRRPPPPRSSTTPTTCAAHLARPPPPYVVKADGLAAGKGVHVGADLAVADRLRPRRAGRARLDRGRRGLPRRARGVAVRAVATARPSCRCCRRRTSSGSATATQGPNTGGMGAYAPLPWLPDGTVEQVQRDGAAAGRRRDGPPRDAVQPGCSTPGWR